VIGGGTHEGPWPELWRPCAPLLARNWPRASLTISGHRLSAPRPVDRMGVALGISRIDKTAGIGYNSIRQLRILVSFGRSCSTKSDTHSVHRRWPKFHSQKSWESFGMILHQNRPATSLKTSGNAPQPPINSRRLSALADQAVYLRSRCTLYPFLWLFTGEHISSCPTINEYTNISWFKDPKHASNSGAFPIQSLRITVQITKLKGKWSSCNCVARDHSIYSAAFA
jgi:hypothetical protein